eukprot:RCo018586
MRRILGGLAQTLDDGSGNPVGGAPVTVLHSGASGRRQPSVLGEAAFVRGPTSKKRGSAYLPAAGNVSPTRDEPGDGLVVPMPPPADSAADVTSPGPKFRSPSSTAGTIGSTSTTGPGSTPAISSNYHPTPPTEGGGDGSSAAPVQPLGFLPPGADNDSEGGDAATGTSQNNTLEEAFNKGNIAYAICICGVLSALVEFCIRQRRDAVRRVLELHPELMRSAELVPNVGVTLAGTKRTMTAQNYDVACKTLYCAKRDIQIADAFELRDAAKLEQLYSGGLKTGIVEACRRNEYAIARRLCHNLYTKNPSYRLTRIGSFSGEAAGVQRMLEKLHEDVCHLCDEDDTRKRREARTCVIL